MNLGENITKYRKNFNLSQENLAEKLSVSRQSVSKWETNASVPEISKLLEMSKMFGITVDELLNDEVTNKTKIIDNITMPELLHNNPKIKGHKILGYILLSSGLLSCILGFIFSILLIVLGLYLILNAIICIAFKNNPILTLIWITLFIICFYLNVMSGTSLGMIFNFVAYQYFGINLIISYVLWTIILIWTYFAFKKYKWTAIGWGLILPMCTNWNVFFYFIENLEKISNLNLFTIINIAISIIFPIVFSGIVIYQHIKKRKNK